MEFVNSDRLSKVAQFMCDVEVDGNYLCGSFLEFLNKHNSKPTTFKQNKNENK